jgi:ABC-type transporter Mla subunit MlaD
MTTTDTKEPPSQNDKMRDTIRQVVEQLATDVRKNLDDLRRQIDDIEQLVIANAERVATSLTDHANICGDVQQEIVRLTAVIAAIRAGQAEAIQMNGVAHDPRR